MKVYLASCYSDPDPSVRASRFDALNRKAGDLIQAGHIVFSPISHSHPISLHMDNSNDSHFWVDQDMAFIPWCDEMWVLRLDGYVQSKGVAREIGEAQRLGKKVRFIDP